MGYPQADVQGRPDANSGVDLTHRAVLLKQLRFKASKNWLPVPAQ